MIIKNYLRHPFKQTFLLLARHNVLNWLPDSVYLKLKFACIMGKRLNIKAPSTFNEKLQWLKLHDRKSEYTMMVDKYEAKKYVADRIGEEYVIPTLGVWDEVESIDFDTLPNQFVLKCTHDSGGLVICREKKSFDKQKAKEKIKCSLKRNFYWYGREWPYKDVKPRIIAEQYMEDTKTEELRDYKFFCFNGRVKCFKIDYDRFKGHRANYYAPNGELMRFGEVICSPDFDRVVSLPKQKDEMIALAEKLSAGHPFLRVDFYEVGQQIYFGELTFFPASGLGPFEPDEWDGILGSWIKLPDEKS